MAETTITIPVWDAAQQWREQITPNIVRQILTITEGDLELVVVDNASPSRETREYLDGVTDSRFHLIRFERNIGYGRGANAGMRYGYARGSQFFVVMNNDVVLNATDWLKRFIAPLRSNPRQIIGTRYINYNAWCFHNGQIVPYLEGYFLAFSRLGLDTFGLFDPVLSPGYAEDVEICWRAQRHGFYLREASIPHMHLYGRTGYQNFGVSEREQMTVRNIHTFFNKVDRDDYSRIWCEES